VADIHSASADGCLIGDLICFLNYFLTGELTVRFVLKAASVLVICGAIFVYYLRSLHWDRNISVREVNRWSARFAAGATAVLVAAFCTGIVAAGTPGAQRHFEADRRRVEALRTVANVVNNWHRWPGTRDSAVMLPNSLYQLQTRGMSGSEILDPETKQPYRYAKKSGIDYELCATFSATEPENGQPATHFWKHGKGETCYVLRATEPVPVY
jgi:hypothetical protein